MLMPIEYAYRVCLVNDDGNRPGDPGVQHLVASRFGRGPAPLVLRAGRLRAGTLRARTVRVGPLAGLLVAGLLAAGCTRVATGHPTPPAFTPTDVSGTVTAKVVANRTVTIHVGERVRFLAPDNLNITPLPTAYNDLRWYGDLDTFVGMVPSRVPVQILNSDKHFHCPNGPCAHPNAPVPMTVHIVAGGKAPTIPRAITLSTTHLPATLRLHIGQALRIPSAVDVSSYAGGDGAVGMPSPTTSNSGYQVIVGAAPGLVHLALSTAGPSSTPHDLRVTVTG